MKLAPHLRLLFAWIFLFSAYCKAETNGMDAEDLVRRKLRESGLHIGFEAQTRRIVQLSFISKELKGAKNDSLQLERIRVVSFLCAERMARSAVMRSLTHVANLETETAVFDNDQKAGMRTSAESSVQSSFYPYGCQIVASAETLTDGILHTAVALSWTPECEKGVRKALGSAPAVFPQLTEPRMPSPEWKAWAEKTDFSRTLGFCCFVDSEGFWRFAGIGMADVEGLTNPTMLEAKYRAARQVASANLAYALLGNIEASRNMNKRLQESETDGVSESEIETVVVDQMRKAVKAVVPDAEVYTTTVVHPLTGRKLFVSVVGIEPCDLAQMNLLGNHP